MPFLIGPGRVPGAGNGLAAGDGGGGDAIRLESATTAVLMLTWWTRSLTSTTAVSPTISLIRTRYFLPSIS